MWTFRGPILLVASLDGRSRVPARYHSKFLEGNWLGLVAFDFVTWDPISKALSYDAFEEGLAGQKLMTVVSFTVL